MIRFENPEWFWLLLLMVPVITLLIWETIKKVSQIAVFREHHRLHSYLTQTGKAILSLLVIGSIGLAIINPQIIRERTVTQMRSEIQVALVFDVSKSMAARKDPESPDRLMRSKTFVYRILPYLEGSEVAVFAFTDIFLSHLSFTANHDIVYETVERVVAIESLPMPGSDLSEVFGGVSGKFDASKKQKIIIVFTDGEIRRGGSFSPETFEKMKEMGIILVLVGVGEPEGAKIPIFNKKGEFTGFYVTSKTTGQTIVSRLDEQSLQDLALRANGQYIHEGGVDTFIDFLSELPGREVVATDRTEKHLVDLYPWFVAFAFLNTIILFKLYD